MVILHHEVDIDFPDGRPTEKQSATLLEFGRTEYGRTTTSMALTVGIPAAIGAVVSDFFKISVFFGHQFWSDYYNYI